MDPITAYIQAAQVLVVAGIALGQEIHDVVVKLWNAFHSAPMTEEELNVFITAVKAKAAAIQAQAEADAAQAKLDENPPAA